MNRTAMTDQDNSRMYALKKTIKDKCRVIGETTMYYGNFGSVQVLSPVPGSPVQDIKPGSDNIRSTTPKSALKVKIEPQVHENGTTNTGRKRPVSQRQKTNNKVRYPQYSLPPLTRNVSADANNRSKSRQSREQRGRKACQFRPTNDNTRHVLPIKTDKWIPWPDFKPSEKKTMPKKCFTSESARLKLGSLGKILDDSKYQRGDVDSSVKVSRNCTVSLDNIHLPPIREVTRVPTWTQVTSPEVRYINIYTDDGKLPPLRVGAMSISNRRIHPIDHRAR